MDVTQKWQSSSGFPSLAPLATAAYAAFLKESRMELANAANINRKSGSQSSLLANCYTPVYHAQAVFGLKGFCGVALFNFEREFSAESNLVVSQAAEQSCEQQQRDVYESHRHRTFSLAFYMTGNEIEAEEILATTFIRAFQQNERPDAFAVDSALVNELSQRFPLKEEQAAAVISPGSSLSHRNVRRPDLEIAVRSLPANERLLFLLRDVEGYAPAAISRLLNIPEPQVLRACFSARIRLCQLLAEQARTQAA
jgi:RNA polymerase sigma-70 factor (ECF subfamily)